MWTNPHSLPRPTVFQGSDPPIYIVCWPLQVSVSKTSALQNFVPDGGLKSRHFTGMNQYHKPNRVS